jgi:hypothetical protein
LVQTQVAASLGLSPELVSRLGLAQGYPPFAQS